METKLVKTSKFMSLVLRHRPDKIGLTLDKNGWAEVSELIDRSRYGSVILSLDLIREVVAQNDKKRFILSEDGARIRTCQGHSLEIDLDLPPIEPPEILYHGTATRFLDSIRQEGLLRGRRHHVHLSLDEPTALNVGQRHGKPALLRIHAGEMWHKGIPFFCSENGVWLTEAIAPEFIDFPASIPSDSSH